MLDSALSIRIDAFALVLRVILAVSWTNASPMPIANFHKVNDHLYRGAQPTESGFKRLQQLGVRTIMDLRIPEQAPNKEQNVVSSLGMRYIAIPMEKRQFPADGEIQRALALINDASL